MAFKEGSEWIEYKDPNGKPKWKRRLEDNRYFRTTENPNDPVEAENFDEFLVVDDD